MSTHQIGHKFVEGLRDCLSADQFSELCRLNAAEANPAICHSHDFVDANEVMAEAFRAVMGREIDLQSDADCTMWAAAWSEA